VAPTIAAYFGIKPHSSTVELPLREVLPQTRKDDALVGRHVR
jgi:hypothetical protein